MARSQRTRHRRSERRGFSLIELLVVITIIALLIGILLPTLSSARDTVRVTTCLSRQHQLSLGVSVYAADHNDQIPRGPHTEPSFIALSFGVPAAATEDQVASSVILNASGTLGVYFNSHGVLLNSYLQNPQSMFCPGDDTIDPQQELQKIRDRTAPAFSSYVYRNLDQAPIGQLSDMGENDHGVTATALLVDSNSIFDAFPDTYRTNHGNDPVNVAYTDGSSQSLRNADNVFSLIPNDYFGGWVTIEAAYNRILINSDRQP